MICKGENEGYGKYITYTYYFIREHSSNSTIFKFLWIFYSCYLFFTSTKLIIFPIFNEINATLRNEHRCKYQESNLLVEFTSKYLVFVRLSVKLLNEYLFQESFEILVQVSKPNYCNNSWYWLQRL